MSKLGESEVDRLKWWRDARFGMFIHWGLYAVPAGVWQGKEIGGLTEWIMCQAKIPLADYRRLAETFNPVDFDADFNERVFVMEHFRIMAARCGAFD